MRFVTTGRKVTMKKRREIRNRGRMISMLDEDAYYDEDGIQNNDEVDVSDKFSCCYIRRQLLSSPLRAHFSHN